MKETKNAKKITFCSIDNLRHNKNLILKVSNLFELLVVSSKDKRFGEWIKCFEILFNATADQIMSDYNQLITLVNVTTITYQHDNRKYDNEYESDILNMIKEYEKYENANVYNYDYDWITVLPNRNRF